MKIINVFLYTSNVQIPLYGHATLIIGISDGTAIMLYNITQSPLGRYLCYVVN